MLNIEQQDIYHTKVYGFHQEMGYSFINKGMYGDALFGVQIILTASVVVKQGSPISPIL